MRNTLMIFVLVFLALVVLPGGIRQARAKADLYPAMAPLDQYLIPDENAEIALALMNQKLAPSLPTVLLVASARNVYLSSSFVRETAMLGGLIVPGSVSPAVSRLTRTPRMPARCMSWSASFVVISSITATPRARSPSWRIPSSVQELSLP